jgi:hypothetical protein
MLSELKQLLEMFEFVTDELQSNRINISRVYPCIQYLLNNLKAKDEFGNDVVYEYTGALRDGLVESLKKRFGVLIKDDLFIISTLLDPNFGLSYLEVEDQQRARSKLISMIRREEAKQLVISSNSEKENNSENLKIKNLLEKRGSNFPQFKPIQHVKKDIIEDLVDNYISTISSGDFKQCALVFWKAHEVKFKAIAEIARKYLGVPASSAAVERIFCISGHILSTKRSKMSVKLFKNLVFLKLNEDLL